jgi:integrase
VLRNGLQETDDGLVIGELKTPSSKRSIRLPASVVTVLDIWRKEQRTQRMAAGPAWHEQGLIFTSPTGGPRDRQYVGRGFREACIAAGIGRWQPRECRHTFCSILSDRGVSLEVISAAMGHVNTGITRSVYHHQLADVISIAAADDEAVS